MQASKGEATHFSHASTILRSSAAESSFAQARCREIFDHLEATHRETILQQISTSVLYHDESTNTIDIQLNKIEAQSIAIIMLPNPLEIKSTESAWTLWECKSNVKFHVDDNYNIQCTLDAEKGDQHEIRFNDRKVVSAILFTCNGRTILRFQLLHLPFLFLLPGSGQRWPVRCVGEIPVFSPLLMYQLDLGSIPPLTVEKLSTFFKSPLRRTKIVTTLPNTAQYKGSTCELGWSGGYDLQISTLPFHFRYLLHVLVARGKFWILEESSIVELVSIMAAKPAEEVEDAVNKLFIAPVSPNPVQTLITALQSVKLSSKPAPSASESTLIRHAYITPLRVIPQRPEVDSTGSNRIIRQYAQYSDRFLRVSFVDEDLSPLSVASATENVIKSRLQPVLREGIAIAGRKYVFLAYSNSQLREQSAWFYCETPEEGDGAQIPTAQEIRASIGDLSNISIPAKYAARLGQAFSTTKSTIQIQANQVKQIPDIFDKNNSLCFTDGCGVISSDLARRMMQLLDPSCEFLPSAFQIRFKGAKGVVSVCPSACKEAILGTYDLALRPSMIKFEGNSDACFLEVCSIATALPCFLNREIIPVLVAGGVSQESFLNLLEMQTDTLRTASKDKDIALDVLRTHARYHRSIIQLLESGADVTDPYLRQFVSSIAQKLFLEMQLKFRLPVSSNAVRLMGIADESKTISSGYVFFQSRSIKSPDAESALAIGRDPCLHPGDIRLLKLFSPPPDSPLLELFDVLLFSVAGERPEANKMGGGDLDGDLYFIIWNSSLSNC